MSAAASSWLHSNSRAHVSAYSGAEPGCCVALQVMVGDASPFEDLMAACEEVASRDNAAASP